MNTPFKAFIVNKENDQFTSGLQTLTLNDLPQGEVLIKVHYSSVNYKDGLASIPHGQIVRTYPHVPGIDASGLVEESSDDRFKKGDRVIVTSYGFGVSHFGGFSEYARVPSKWVVHCPDSLSLREAMAYGTAGFTAALSVLKLQHQGITPESGDIVVTGASGGVGSVAVAMLAKQGYNVFASTGKSQEHDYLKQLGAVEVLSREELSPPQFTPLGKGRFIGAIDPVGGNTLAYLLSVMKYGGTVACTGLTAGSHLNTTVYPFILRGVSLMGVDSVECPMSIREPLWQRMASDMKPDNLEGFIGEEITLEDLPAVFTRILNGETKGRVVVKVSD